MSTTVGSGCAIERVDVAAYTVPTDRPEADGTFSWDSTTMVLVELHAGGHAGLGWTYAAPAVAALVRDELIGVVRGRDAMDVPAAWAAMTGALRNAVTSGLSAFAVAAVDVALWDLKARLLDVSLVTLLGRRRAAVPIYGSGGFTSYDDATLREQLSGWAEQGIGRLKMKVGSDPGADPDRVRAAREAVGPDVELMVDGNGAWTPDQALVMAERFAEDDVRWFEEPVSSDDVEGLRRVRDRAPAGMAVAAGEYVTDAYGFRRLLAAQAVDVLQGDATRCGGITGVLRDGRAAREAGSTVYVASTFDGPLGVAGGVHAAAALAATGPVPPCGLATLGLFEGFEGVLGPVAGRVAVPRGPGLLRAPAR